MDEDFSNEGLYRLIEKMDREHGDDLKEIRRQTTETNGRVRSLETRVNRNDQELKRINSAVFPRASMASAVPAEQGEYFGFRMSPKLWTVLAGAGGVLFAMAMESFKQWLAKK